MLYGNYTIGYMKGVEINHLDLFSGIGGFHLGFERAGFKINSYFSEIDKYAIQVYKDKFKCYSSRWHSFRSHSKFLKGERYRKLFDCDIEDWECQVYEVKMGGYATDKKYIHTLINLGREMRVGEIFNL